MLDNLTFKIALRFFIPAATAAAAVGGGTYFLIPKSTKKPANPNENPTDPTQVRQQKHVTKGNMFDINFTYVVAKLSDVTDDASTSKFNLHSSGFPFVSNFVCKLQDSDTAIDACRLFALNKGEDANTINLQHTKEISSSVPKSLIKKTSDLKNDKHVVLRFSKNKKDAFTGADAKTINIFRKDDQTKKIATLTYLFDLEKSHLSPNLTIDSSSLILVQVSEAATADISADSTFKCKFNSQEAIECKIYKLTKEVTSSTAITKTTFDGLSPSITSKDDLAKDKYILVDLLNHKKAISDLEIADIELQKADGSKVAKALFTDILIGKVDSTNLDQSIIYPVEKTAHHFRETFPRQTRSFFVTSVKHIFDNSTIDWARFQHDVVCKVSTKNQWFIDDHCKLYEFDAAADKSYLLDDSSLYDKTIKAKTTLEPSKQQLIHISDDLFDKLDNEKPIIELINKDKKEHYWGNKFALLENPLPIHEFKKSSLAIARVKAKASTSTPITTDTLTCVLKDGAQVACKLHDFSAAQYSNNIDKTALNAVSPWNKTLTDLKKDRLFLVEFIKTDDFDVVDPKTQNTFELKFGSTKLVDMEIDQLVFGNIQSTPKNLFTKKGKQALYIVELTKDASGWSSTNLPNDYRCVYQVGQITKYDDSCKLVALPEYEESNQFISYKQLTDLRDSKPTRSTTITDTTIRYGLLVDESKIPGIDQANLATAKIKFEKASTASNATNQLYATANLKHKIVDNGALGLLEYFVGNLEAGESSKSKDTCIWSSAEKERFTCQAFDQTTQNKVAWKTTSFNKSALEATDRLTNKNIILFKVDGSIGNEIWKRRPTFYFFNSSDSDPSKVETNNPSFSFKAALGGIHADGKKMYELLKS